MDLRPRVARRIIDRLQEFLYPMDDDDQARVVEVIVDELSSSKDRVTSRSGFTVSTEDQDCVQAFLDLYPDLRHYVETLLVPQIRERFPGLPILMSFWVDPEAGFSGLYETRHLTIGIAFPGELTYDEVSKLFEPFNQWLYEQELELPREVTNLVHVWRHRPCPPETRMEAALDWLNIKPWYLTNTVGLPEEVVERLIQGEATEPELKDFCSRLGISYQWITDPSPPPVSAYECWDEFRTRRGE